jgi:hypothetical protein
MNQLVVSFFNQCTDNREHTLLREEHWMMATAVAAESASTHGPVGAARFWPPCRSLWGK